MSHPYREPGHVETDDQKVARLQREYDAIAISAQTTPEADAKARARMREIAGILAAMRPRPTPPPGTLIGAVADLLRMDRAFKDAYRR